jgi:hypothetical protein
MALITEIFALGCYSVPIFFFLRWRRSKTSAVALDLPDQSTATSASAPVNPSSSSSTTELQAVRQPDINSEKLSSGNGEGSKKLSMDSDPSVKYVQVAEDS